MCLELFNRQRWTKMGQMWNRVMLQQATITIVLRTSTYVHTQPTFVETVPGMQPDGLVSIDSNGTGHVCP